MTDDDPLTEPVPVPDTFVNGLIEEDFGEYVRLTYYVDRDPVGAPAPSKERVIVSRIVFVKSHWEAAISRVYAERERRRHRAHRMEN